jgi:hypothetical protein
MPETAGARLHKPRVPLIYFLHHFFHHGDTEKNLNRQEPQRGFARPLGCSVSACLRGRKANWDTTLSRAELLLFLLLKCAGTARFAAVRGDLCSSHSV